MSVSRNSGLLEIGVLAPQRAPFDQQGFEVFEANGDDFEHRIEEANVANGFHARPIVVANVARLARATRQTTRNDP